MANTKKKTSIFRLVNKNEKPSIKGRNYPVSHRIPSVDEVYDESTGRNRKIRYILGEQSIYEDEQTTDNPVLGDIIFNNGSIPVQYQQVTLREFLETTNYNISNPDRMNGKKAIFELVDTEVNAKKDLDTLESEFHALEVLMGMDAQKMVGYARAMGVNVDRSMYEIKHDMMVMAKSNSELFLDSISDPKIERKQVIMDAQDERIIVINQSKRNVSWGFGTKEVICVVPVGIAPIDHFIDFTFEDDGKEVFKTIKKMLAGETTKPSKKKEVKETIEFELDIEEETTEE